MPVTISEGIRPEQGSVSREHLERRYSALAAAVKAHELSTARSRLARSEDRDLYRRMRQLTGEAEWVA